MPIFIYQDKAGSFRPEAIMDDLIAALGITPYVEGAPDGSLVKISVPEGVAQSAVDALIAAHDPNEPSIAEIAAQQQQAVETALKQTDMASIQQAIGAAKDVDTLREATLALSDVVINLKAAVGS